MTTSPLSQKICAASGRVDMVKVLVKDLKLPDPTKLRGLRQFAANFATNNRKINNCYDAHHQPPDLDLHVLHAIVLLWGKLGVDAVLRDKLFAHGMLERMVPLLREGDKPIRTAILFALSNFTHHGGIDARRTIAELTTPTLVQLVSAPECSAREAELGSAVLAHSLSNTLANLTQDFEIGSPVIIPDILRTVDPKGICTAIGTIIRRPDVDIEAISHAITLLKALSFFFRDAVLSTNTHRIFIAALASKDIQVRLEGYTGAVRVGASKTESEGRHLDPRRVTSIAKEPEDYFTPELMRALRTQYGGLEGGMIHEIAGSTSALNSATLQLGRRFDYLEFGRTMCKRVLECEYSLSQGVMQGPDGKMETFDDYFERAAAALAKSTDPADVLLASVLRVKIAMTLGDRHEIIRLSALGSRNYPEVAFFYYTQASWTEDPRTQMRLAKKGLACSDLTNYVKRGLLFLSAESGYNMIVTGPFELAEPGSSAWREGVAMLHCAQEDSKAYIEMTPMDQRNLKTMIYTYLSVTFILEGDKVLANPDPIRPYLEKLSLAEQIYAVVCRPLPLTTRKLAIDLIIPQFTKPLKQWRPAISRLEGGKGHHHHHQHLPRDDPDHVLAHWLARTALDGEDAPEHELAELETRPDEPAPGTSAKDVLVYRCSLCGNPSASLMKCGRCKQARYCDDLCQRKHWKKGHKTVCKPA